MTAAKPLIRLATLLLVAAATPAALASAASPAMAAEELPAEIREILDRNDVPPAAVSLLAYEPGAAKPRLQFQAEQPRNPASVMKLFTTYAALEGLGPGHTWQTRIHADGPVNDGTLEGDLWIEGSGDPLLTAERFWELVGTVQRRGVERITGDLVYDRSRFAPASGSPGDFDARPYRAYNQAPHPLLVHYNAVQLELEALASEDRVRLGMYPPLEGLALDNRVHLDDDTWCNAYRWHLDFRVDQGGNPPTAVVDGAYSSGCGVARLYRTALPVEEYVHDLFGSLWSQWGGEFAGGWRAGEWGQRDADPLVEHESEPLAEAVRRINKYSNNVMTRQLALSLAAEARDGPVTEADGRTAVRRVLEERGVDTDGMVLAEVAGLSRDNRVSAAQVGELLEIAADSLVMPELKASLPVAGVDGTLAERLEDSPAAGRVRMKTGMLRDVSAIAGYMRDSAGDDLIVAILINGGEVRGGSGMAVQDAILEWLFET